MLKVLHLIDAASSTVNAQAVAMVRDAMVGDDTLAGDVLLIGGTAFGQLGAAAGIETCHRVGAGGRHPWVVWPAIAHRLRTIGPVDVLHCWSTWSLKLARCCAPQTPKVLTLTDAPTAVTLRWLSAIMRRRSADGISIICSYQALADTLVTAGVPAQRTCVIEPGLDVARLSGVDRPAIRHAWQIDSQTTTVVALLSDQPDSADTMAATMAAAMVAASLDSSQSLRLLIHPHQRYGLCARRLVVGMGLPDLLIQEARLIRPWSVLPACDAALVLHPGASGLSGAWAMAAGVPTIADRSVMPLGWATHEQSALLVDRAGQAELAYMLQRLLREPRLGVELARSAREAVRRRLPIDRYRSALAEAYHAATQQRQVV
jgi:hypothetical protein